MPTFDTKFDRGAFVEVPDPTQVGQPKRPGAGLALQVRSYPGSVALTPVTTSNLGYIEGYVTDTATIIEVSADGANWYRVNSRESLDMLIDTSSTLPPVNDGWTKQQADERFASYHVHTDTGGVIALYDTRSQENASDYATLQEGLDATPVGGTFHIPPGTYTPGATLAWPEAVTIDGGGRATITTTSDRAIFTFDGGPSDRVMRGLTLVGSLTPNTAATMNYQRGIDSAADATDPAIGLTVENCTFRNFHGYGVKVAYCENIRVKDCTFDQYGYAGIGLHSCDGARVTDNDFTGTGVLPTFAPNSYATFFSVSKNDGVPGNPAAPFSTDITFSGNTVRNQAWEGFDTHCGQRITITDNRFYDCSGVAIAIVGSQMTNLRESDEIVVANNIIIGLPDHTSNVGIAFMGRDPEAGAIPIKGTISGNYIARCGNDDSATDGGILVSNGRGVTVGDNSIHECRPCGISVEDSYGTLVTGNSIVDVWSDAGKPSAIRVVRTSLADMEVAVVGNRLTRGTLQEGVDGVSTPADINYYGFMASRASDPTVTVYESSNFFSSTNGNGGGFTYVAPTSGGTVV